MTDSIVRGQVSRMKNTRYYYIQKIQHKTPTTCPECKTVLIVDGETIYCPLCGLVTQTSTPYVAGQLIHLPHGLKLG